MIGADVRLATYRLPKVPGADAGRVIVALEPLPSLSDRQVLCGAVARVGERHQTGRLRTAQGLLEPTEVVWPEVPSWLGLGHPASFGRSPYTGDEDRRPGRLVQAHRQFPVRKVEPTAPAHRPQDVHRHHTRARQLRAEQQPGGLVPLTDVQTLGVRGGGSQLPGRREGIAVVPFRDDGDHQGRLPRPPDLGEVLRAVPMAGAASLARLPARVGHRPARTQHGLDGQDRHAVVGIPQPENVLGDRESQSGAEFGRLLVLVVVTDPPAFAGQPEVLAVARQLQLPADGEGLVVLECAPVLRHPPARALRRQCGGRGQGVQDVPHGDGLLPGELPTVQRREVRFAAQPALAPVRPLLVVGRDGRLHLAEQILAGPDRNGRRLDEILQDRLHRLLHCAPTVPELRTR